MREREGSEEEEVKSPRSYLLLATDDEALWTVCWTFTLLQTSTRTDKQLPLLVSPNNDEIFARCHLPSSPLKKPIHINFSAGHHHLNSSAKMEAGAMRGIEELGTVFSSLRSFENTIGHEKDTCLGLQDHNFLLCSLKRPSPTIHVINLRNSRSSLWLLAT